MKFLQIIMEFSQDIKTRIHQSKKVVQVEAQIIMSNHKQDVETYVPPAPPPPRGGE